MQTTISDTHFAPAERASSTAVAALAGLVDRDSTLRDAIEGFPEICLVLNEQRQIVACNRYVLNMLGVTEPSAVLGARPGEAVGCVHSHEMSGGCGTSEACRMCGAVEAIIECARTRQQARRECHICTDGPNGPRSLELQVLASPLRADTQNLVILAGTDISASKRRAVLERLFFHDVLNLAGGISGLSRLCSMDLMPLSKENAGRLYMLSNQLVEEISAQRDLAYAERGELAMQWSQVKVSEMFASLQAMFVSHPAAEGRKLAFALTGSGDLTLETDERLLRRVLGNMIKNAFEASRPGQQVTVTCRSLEDARIEFAVHDPAVMPRDVQLQIFHRSFTTKGGTGRGLGTYSVKLFATSYLGGSVEFESNEATGTTFRACFNRARPAVAR